MMIVTCPNCGARNRVVERAERMRPVCGRCGAKLEVGQAAGGGVPLVVTDESFDRLLAEAGDRPVLVDCWAAWCGPCRMIAPVIDQLAAESAGRYIVAKLDVDANQRTAARFNIANIPALLIFRRGRLIEQLVGLRPKEQIAAQLGAHGG